MNPVYVEAIAQKRRLRCSYHGKPRLIEPQCYGIGHRGTELLRVYLPRGGGSTREPLFNTAEIVDLEVLDEVFARPGPNYKRNDSAMQTIFAQL